MAKVFYAEYRHDPKQVSDKLNANGIEHIVADCRFEGDLLHRAKIAYGKFKRRCPDPSQYKVIIAHLGTYFNREILNLLKEHPNTSVAIVTMNPEDYIDESDDSNRIALFGYEAFDKLIGFVNTSLNR